MMVVIFTQIVSVEEELGVACLGHDVSLVAPKFRRIKELEMRLGQENPFLGIDTSYTTTVIVDEEVSAADALIRNRRCRRNWFGLLVLAI
ncbi:hypothetical protein QYF36_006580 [Acer negundo]|nr:hypothetical protein QYF36_006580 [Acer negundo]